MRSAVMILAVVVSTLPLALICSSLAQEKESPLPLLVREDFKDGAGRWAPTDPKAWRVIQTDRGLAYNQFRESNYKPPHRSPFNIALLKDVHVGDFILEASVQSTVKDYGHRDACLIFGYQDPAHFYYVHFGKQADDHANQIFIVNAAPRKKISNKTTSGTNWGDGWHKVKVVRRVESGLIEAYFDDMKASAMVATDKTFAWGQVGIGTFDDSANWMDIRLHGVKAAKR